MELDINLARFSQ